MIKGKQAIYGHDVYLIGMKIDNDYLIIATNQKADDAIKIYAERWQIETLFACLKSKGFYFEETRIIKRERIKKLIAVLAIAFCLAHITGKWSHRYEKIILLKKDGRPQESYFPRGLDKMKECLFKRGQKVRHLTRILEQCFVRHLQPRLGVNP